MCTHARLQYTYSYCLCTSALLFAVGAVAVDAVSQDVCDLFCIRVWGSPCLDVARVHVTICCAVQGSNESSDDEGAPRQSQIYSDGETDAGVTDPGITEAGLSEVAYPDTDAAHHRSNDPMTSMGSTAFWDPPDLQHPANSNQVLDTSTSDVGTGSGSASGADPLQGSSSAGAQTVIAKVSPGTRRIARVRRRHLGMLQTMLEASRRASEFVTSVRYPEILSVGAALTLAVLFP